MNPHWRELVSEWEEKYGLEFRIDGRMVAKPGRGGWATDPSKLVPGSPAALAAAAAQKSMVAGASDLGNNDARHPQPRTKDPSTPVSRAGESARESGVPGNAIFVPGVQEPSSAQDA